MSLAPVDRGPPAARLALLVATVLGGVAVLMTVLAWPVTLAAATVTPGAWQWPLAPQPQVVRQFEAPAGPYAAGHRGVDLGGLVGQQVRAAGPGVVAFAGMVAGRGVVSVQHEGGRRTTYEPVAAVVHTGDQVGAGAVLGTVMAAPGHCLPGTCLHWGLRLEDGSYLDPLSLLGRVSAARVRLLPVWTDRGPLLARG